jgi:hypothetical protein
MTTIQPTTLTLVAIDLAGSEEYGRLWRTLKTAIRVPREFLPGLPVGGLATPVGYWFSETEERREAGVFRVDVLSPGRAAVHPTARTEVATSALDHRQFPKVLLSAQSARRLSPALTDGLTLEIGSNWARVGVDPSAWSAVATPVLLSISVCWRLIQVVRQLDELTDWARDACGRPARLTGWSTILSRRRELGDRLRTMRRLLIDLPCYEGPLIDPRGYFSSRRPANLYRALVKRLELDGWRALIDERIEIVEATLDALAEERRHRDALTCEVVLEVLILLSLVADIAINLSSALLGSSS